MARCVAGRQLKAAVVGAADRRVTAAADSRTPRCDSYKAGPAGVRRGRFVSDFSAMMNGWHGDETPGRSAVGLGPGPVFVSIRAVVVSGERETRLGASDAFPFDFDLAAA